MKQERVEELLTRVLETDRLARRLAGDAVGVAA